MRFKKGDMVIAVGPQRLHATSGTVLEVIENNEDGFYVVEFVGGECVVGLTDKELRGPHSGTSASSEGY